MVNTADQRIERNFSSGLGTNPSGIAVTRNGAKAYVANFGGLVVNTEPHAQTVSVLDTHTGTVITTIPVGLQPVRVYLSRDNTRAYVVNSGTLHNNGGISVIDTSTDTVIQTITDGIDHPSAFALTPDGAHAYVPNSTRGRVAVVDVATGTVSTQIALQQAESYPADAVVSPDGARVYVSNNLAGTVSVIDTTTRETVGEPIALNSFGMPYSIAITPDGARLYVTISADNEVVVVDTATATALPAKITVGRNPVGVAVTPDGTRVYVTSSLDDSRGLSVIDVASGRVITRMNVGSGPFAVAFADMRG